MINNSIDCKDNFAKMYMYVCMYIRVYMYVVHRVLEVVVRHRIVYFLRRWQLNISAAYPPTDEWCAIISILLVLLSLTFIYSAAISFLYSRTYGVIKASALNFKTFIIVKDSAVKKNFNMTIKFQPSN